jgi:nucleotide-binding universal stress UspA family protein
VPGALKVLSGTIGPGSGISQVIVGVGSRAGASHAVAYARRLADALGASVVLACAFPYRDVHEGGGDPHFRDALRRTEEMLERIRDRFCPAATIRALPDFSPPRALHRLAELEGAGLLVLGRGRSFGSVEERVFCGAPCAVAVVPPEIADDPIERVGCGVDGRPESAGAMGTAAALARGLGAELELVRAVAPQGLPPGRTDANRTVSEVLAELRGRAAALRGSGIAAHASYVQDDAERALVQHSQTLDLLVLGSRSYGPGDCVLLGAVARRLVKDSSCPVLVTPRASGGDPLHRLGAPGAALAVPPGP